MSSLPIVDKFLQCVIVLTVSSTKLYAEDELKFDKNAQRSCENTLLLRDLLLTGCIK